MARIGTFRIKAKDAPSTNGEITPLINPKTLRTLSVSWRTQYKTMQEIHASNNQNDLKYKLTEMDADHVSAWSKGGSTTIGNCEMLCKTHNRAKGNK
jgi:hypothetical protein